MRKKDVKKLGLLLGVTGMLAAPSMFAAVGDTGMLKLSASAFSFHSGGEFTATDGAAHVLGTFQTFCLEYGEDFGSQAWYHYTVNVGAVAGGPGPGGVVPGTPGANTHDSITGLTMDKISIGTAYLYSQFRANALPGPSGSGTYLGANHLQNAGALQDAIWYLEGEIPSLVFNGADGTGYYNYAKQHAGGGNLNDAQVTADSNGAYGVVVVNLFGGPYAKAIQGANGVTYYVNQDQLAIVPEPTTLIAGALLLLPFGASTLNVLRRKQKQ